MGRSKLNLVNNSLNEIESIIDAISCHFRNHPSVTEIKKKRLCLHNEIQSLHLGTQTHPMLHFY